MIPLISIIITYHVHVQFVSMQFFLPEICQISDVSSCRRRRLWVYRLMTVLQFLSYSFVCCFLCSFAVFILYRDCWVWLMLSFFPRYRPNDSAAIRYRVWCDLLAPVLSLSKALCFRGHDIRSGSCIGVWLSYCFLDHEPSSSGQLSLSCCWWCITTVISVVASGRMGCVRAVRPLFFYYNKVSPANEARKL